MQPRAKKRFGQHFLHDKGIVQKIVSLFHAAESDRVVEIGPGPGALTLPLLQQLDQLHVVEFDHDMAAHLVTRLSDEEQHKLILHQADALDFDFCSLTDAPTSLRVIGNLPYNISTPLLFHLLDQRRCIKDMLFMLQKEVVDRICAPPGSKQYGRLSVMIQYHCRVRRCFTLGPGCFAPPPKVDSAVVHLIPLAEPEYPAQDIADLQHVVQMAFGQRRKTLRNSLKGVLSEEEINNSGIKPERRPETLSLSEFVTLANTLNQKNKTP